MTRVLVDSRLSFGAKGHLLETGRLDGERLVTMTQRGMVLLSSGSVQLLAQFEPWYRHNVCCGPQGDTAIVGPGTMALGRIGHSGLELNVDVDLPTPFAPFAGSGVPCVLDDGERVGLVVTGESESSVVVFGRHGEEIATRSLSQRVTWAVWYGGGRGKTAVAQVLFTDQTRQWFSVTGDSIESYPYLASSHESVVVSPPAPPVLAVDGERGVGWWRNGALEYHPFGSLGELGDGFMGIATEAALVDDGWALVPTRQHRLLVLSTRDGLEFRGELRCGANGQLVVVSDVANQGRETISIRGAVALGRESFLVHTEDGSFHWCRFE